MQFRVYFEFIYLILEPGTYQTSKLVQYIIGIRTETSHGISALHSSRNIYMFTVFIFNYKALFFCVKDWACLKLAIPAYCLKIFIVCIGTLTTTHPKQNTIPIFHAKPSADLLKASKF